MSLTWKDTVATALTAGVALIAYAKLMGWEVPLIGNWRLATLAIFILGMGTCIVIGSGGGTPESNVWTITAGVLGALALLLLIVGLVIDSKVAFILLAGDIVVLWAVSTLHHMLTSAA